MELSSSTFDATRQHADYEPDENESGQPRPLSGPGTSRQTRRLQLRNAGFRGAAVPTRKVTPKSLPSSNWSSTCGRPGSSDAENVSPSGWKQSISSTGRRKSSGILQEVGNSTVTRPKKHRPRMSSSKLFSNDDSGDNAAYEGAPSSPPPLKTTIRTRSVKSRQPKVSHRRRSVSAEMSKYIEHLETELAATQSQLSAIASPTVTREHNSKMRTLNAESKHLHDELAEWETKYEVRVQEEVDKHCAIESSLRNRIRDLEQDVDETKSRVQELEIQLESTSESLEAVEAANVNLEKRIEIMSELLAASPTKIDLHAQTPGRAQKHIRPKSMLPRFPTASSLIGSPERQPRTQPASPLLSFATQSPNLPESPSHGSFPLELHSDYTSEAESVFSEASITGDSMTSVEQFEGRSSFNPWSMPLPSNTRPRPMRRMRRFGAGSVGPKPLILPSTSQCDNFPPSSAPPLERSETTPVFPLSRTKVEQYGDPFNGRRRASTIATEISIANIVASPIATEENQRFNGDTLMTLSSPLSSNSQDMTQRLSSFGSGLGCNLMDELTAVRSNEWTESTEPASDTPYDGQVEGSSEGLEADVGERREIYDEAMGYGVFAANAESRITSTSSRTAIPVHRRSRSRSMNTPVVGTSLSAFDRLRILFGDLWRSPIALARHFIQAAQTRMRIPRPLLNVQWWLVGVLLGPMARRRMLPRADCSEDLEEQPLQLEHTPSKSDVDEELAYGTMCQTPTRSPTSKSSRTRRRGGSKTRCPHSRSKHSPLLWIKFSITLAFAIGAAFKDGPGSLLKSTMCSCRRKAGVDSGRKSDERSLSPA